MTENPSNRKPGKHRWYATGAIVVLVAGIVVFAAFKLSGPPRNVPWVSTPHGDQFHAAIRDADRVVIRRGGFDCCRSVDDDPIILTITDPTEIDRLRSHLVFESNTTSDSFITCECCGYPGIDWYKGDERIALTSVQHVGRIRWKGFSTLSGEGDIGGYGDAPLTKASAKWLRYWLKEKGLLRRLR